MPSQKFTIRLPPALASAVQAHLAATGGLFADLARAALSAYLADTPPTGADIQADTSADRLTALEIAVDALTQRMDSLEHARTPRRQVAGRRRQPPADTPPTGADTALARMRTLRAQGRSLAQIAATLTQEGFPTRSGKPWHKGTVGYLLQQGS
jgi:hypothetical protein